MKTKRPRILPVTTKSVDARIQAISKELGLTKFDIKWQSIINEVRQLKAA